MVPGLSFENWVGATLSFLFGFGSIGTSSGDSNLPLVPVDHEHLKSLKDLRTLLEYDTRNMNGELDLKGINI